MFLLIGSFIAGMLTVLAPCVLPLLPVIIGGSVSGNTKDKRRPLIIAVSLAISIIFFTLLLKATTLLINVPPTAITYISGTIIVALGIVTFMPGVYARIIGGAGIEAGAQKVLSKGYTNTNSIIGPAITGAALGPVFSSCSPVYAYILATVLPVNFSQAFAYIIAYVLGLSAILLAIGYYGQRFVSKIKFASNPKGTFQRVLAIIFIVVGLLIITGYDKKFQTYVSQHTPFNFDALSSKLLPSSANKIDESKLFNVEPYDAPEFVGAEGWINSKPLKMSELKGKVVMVDFWTYSCINCIRNNPYIEKWYQTYKDDGFVVVGAHAPEFAFEKNKSNVEKAVKDQKLSYPIFLDNNFDTWNAYNNRSWPASYLIDAEGKVRRIHEGEGKYAESEEAIRQLLVENGANLDMSKKVSDSVVPVKQGQTPETYLGRKRASNYVGTPSLGASTQSQFNRAEKLASNQWTLEGAWEIQPEKIIAKSNTRLIFKVLAKDVYFVAGADSAKSIGLKVDGVPVGQTKFSGSDVREGAVSVGESKLYRLFDFKKFSKDKIIELDVPEGVEINVFTFGS